MISKKHSIIFTLALIILASFYLTACNSSANKNSNVGNLINANSTNPTSSNKANLKSTQQEKPKQLTQQNEQNKILSGLQKTLFKNNNKLWARLSNNFQWHYSTEQSRVQFYIEKYKKQLHHFKQLSVQATPYLYYIVNELEQQNLPGELAIIPMIESSYKPLATSNVGASGLWQLTAVTAKRYGVESNKWYDGRRDIDDSTKAAITYLKFLHKEFNNDWLLALAAYNAGEGKVRSAIRKNKRLNKPVNYWDLPLPTQTKQFVPKILAISYLLKDPAKYGITLTDIENKPYFVKVDAKTHMTLNTAAKLAGTNVSQLKQLNAGYIRHYTPPNGPRKLFIPSETVNTFKLNIAKASKNHYPGTIIHKVKRGNSLSSLARKYKTSVPIIKVANNLSNNVIVIGKDLVIPVATIQTAKAKSTKTVKLRVKKRNIRKSYSKSKLKNIRKK